MTTCDRVSITDETKLFIDKMSQQSPDESTKAIDITGDDSDSDHGMTNCWVKIIDKFYLVYDSDSIRLCSACWLLS